MDIFQQLRKQAAAKRDLAIKVARVEHKATLSRITYLQRRLGGKDPSMPRRPPVTRTLTELLCDVLPTDKTFTLEGAVSLMKQAEPERVVRPETVRALFHGLIKNGQLRKVKRWRGRMLWATAAYTEPIIDIGHLDMTQAAQFILKDSTPKRQTEMVVALQDRGYRPDDDPVLLLKTLGLTLNRHRGRFDKSEDGRWSLRSVMGAALSR